MAGEPDPLSQPLTIGGRHLRGRVVATPHLGRLAPERLATYLARRVEGGIAMAVLPAGQGVYLNPTYPPEICAALEPEGVNFHPRDERYRTTSLPAHYDGLAALAEVVRRGGALAVGQLYHPGAEQTWDSFHPAIAPSAVRGDALGTVPHALSTVEISDLIDAYAAAASAIAGAGLDGVELHASHGYLLNQFLSPYYNRRTDEYHDGTVLLGRMLAAVRERVGGRILGVRLQVDEEIADGLDPAGALRVATAIAPYVDYLSLSIGNHDGLRIGRPTIAYTSPWLVDPAPAADAARFVRTGLAAAGLARPILVTGRITTATVARRLLADGTADMIGLARALIADPDFAVKATTGQEERITECIGCNECTRVPFSCPVNPHAGREGRLVGRSVASRSAARRMTARRIVVVGAGPAGVQAATGAADRGHRVVLLDRASGVGGALRLLSATPLLSELGTLRRQLERRVLESDVEFRPGITATAEVLASLESDAVVWAAGSTPAPAVFPSETQPLSTMDILAGARPPAGTTAAAVGGVEPGLEPFVAADVLAAEGWPVILLSERRDPGSDVEPRTLNALLHRLVGAGVDLRPMTRAVEWAGGTLRTELVYGGRRAELACEAVVVAHGRQAAPPPAGDVTVYVIGDALAPRRITHAILEGTRFGAAL